ncbi:autotransporter outer membrane beta-barrel domain-containing protein [Cereibacter changlensis]|nr:autotransporter domain-containing protein [Cereibacter changlensis]
MTPGTGSLTVTDQTTGSISYTAPTEAGVYDQTVLLNGSTSVSNADASALLMEFGSTLEATEVNADVTIDSGVSLASGAGAGAVRVGNADAGDITIDNAGRITAIGDETAGISAVTALGRVTISNSGGVSSASGTGIYAYGDYLGEGEEEPIAVIVTNTSTGTIEAASGAAIRAGSENRAVIVTNEGRLSGVNGAVVAGGADGEPGALMPGDAIVLNYGAINTTSTAISVNGSENLVANYGSVTSLESPVISTGDGFSNVVNYGQITAASEDAVAVSMGARENVFMMFDGSQLTGRVVNAGEGNILALNGSGADGLELAQVAEGQKYSGFGNLYKFGGGIWTLNGSGSSIEDINLVEGTLAVDGSVDANVQVYTTALLAGSGTVGNVDVASGGAISPGLNSIDTLTIDGDVTFRAGSAYAVDLNSAGDSDLLYVSGRATIEDDTVLRLTATPALTPFDLATRFDLVTADGGISDSFASVEENLAFLTADQQIEDNTLFLQFSRTMDGDQPLAFASVAMRPNAKAAAAAVDAMGAGSLFDRALFLTDEAAPTAFDQLTGEIHSVAAAALIDRSRLTRESILARMNDASQLGFAVNPSSKGAAMMTGDPSLGWTLWGQGFGGWTDYEDDGNAFEADVDGGGILIGADRELGDWRVGVALGFGTDDVSSVNGNSTADIDSTYLAAYAGRSFGQATLKLGAIHAMHQLETSRTADFGGVSQSLDAEYDATTTQVFAEGSWRTSYRGLGIEPFANLAYVSMESDGFSESGGDAAVSSRSESRDQVTSTLGVRVNQAFTMGGTDGLAQIGLGWRRAYGDMAQESTLSFAGSNGFNILSAATDRDALVLDLAMRFDVNPTTTLSIGYNALFAEDNNEQAAIARLSIRF